MSIIKDIYIIINDLMYKNICLKKIENNNIDIKVEERHGMLYIEYNNRKFMLKKYGDLNIILRSIIKGNDY